MVNEVNGFLDSLFGITGDVGLLWDVLTQQAIDILINGSLPGCIGMSEVDVGAKTTFEFREGREFLAVVDGEGFPQGSRNIFELSEAELRSFILRAIKNRLLRSTNVAI